jgi:hypothetical protein
MQLVSGENTIILKSSSVSIISESEKHCASRVVMLCSFTYSRLISEQPAVSTIRVEK